MSTKSILEFDPWHFAANKTGALLRNNQQLLLWLIVLNVAAFFIFIAQHPLHNHGLRLPWVADNDQLNHGRWFHVVLLRITGGADVPVFLPVFAILVNCVAAIVAIRDWKLNLSEIEQFIVAGLFTTSPMFLAAFYYTWATPVYITGPAFAVLAVALCKKLSIASIALCSFIFFLGMGTYQPAISVFITMAIASSLAQLITDKSLTLEQHFKRVLSLIISAVIGGIAYLATIKYFEISSHATKTISLSDYPDRLFEIIRVAFNHLFITQPEFLSVIKSILLAVLISALILALLGQRNDWKRMLLIGIYSLVMVVATKAMYLISSDHNFYTYRYNTSMVVMYTFGFAVLIHSTPKGILRSIAIGIAVFTLFRFVQADLIRQEVLYRGQQHDLALANRILDRIEQLPNLDPDKTYNFIRVGRYSSFRQSILASRGHKADELGENHMDWGEVTDIWVPADVFKLLGNKVKLKTGYNPKFQEHQAAAKDAVAGRNPWPHKDSVFIMDDTIVVYMN